MLDQSHFDGLVEIEFISNSNLVFAFPTIMAFYRSGDRYSAVHSVGHIRNPDEPRHPRRSTETNWTCKFAHRITPFFTVFNGPRTGALGNVVISVYNRSGTDRPTDLRPFSSRAVRLDESLDVSNSVSDHPISINLPDDDFVPRLVVGNYHRDIEFIEATHSFYWSQLGDDMLRPHETDLLRFIPAPNIPELGLELVFFPTNVPSQITASLRESLAGERLREIGQTMTWVIGGAGAELWRYHIRPDAALVSFDFRSQHIPARLNASYRYSVRGIQSPFCTDIASGAHAYVYGPKYSHWGHGLISNDCETVVMIRNIAHHRAQAPVGYSDLDDLRFSWRISGQNYFG